MTAYLMSPTLKAMYTTGSAQTDQEKEWIMKKLSEQFLEMSQHTAALEKQIEAAREIDRQQTQAVVTQARARVKAFQDSFAAQLAEAEESFAEDWRTLDEAFTNQVTRAQRRLDEGLNALDAADARAWAEDAEAYAEAAAEFAKLAAAEAEAAMAEAKKARANANSLEK
jgi:hypothetical protein